MIENQSSNEKSYSVRHIELKVYVFLSAIIFTVYFQVINHEFITFDDFTYVLQNPYVQNGLSFESLKWAFSFDDKGGYYWQPLTWLSHMLDISLYGNNAGCHLLTNVAIHFFNTCVLFTLFFRKTEKVWACLFISIIFAIHPVNVESVAWIASRKNLLSTLFLLLTLAAYFRYVNAPNIKKFLVVLILFFLGLMSKPMLVTLPIMLFLLDYWPLSRFAVEVKLRSKSLLCEFFNNKNLLFCLVEKLPFLVITIGFSWLITSSLSSYRNYVSFSQIPFQLRIENIPVALCLNFKNYFFPNGLAIFYPFPTSLQLSQVLLTSSIVLVISAFAMFSMKKYRFFVVGWIWFVATYIPVMGIVQAGLWPARADRWAYIPYIGLSVIVVWTAVNLTKKFNKLRFFTVSAGVIFCIFLVLMTFWQVRVWRDNISVFSHSVNVTHNNVIAHNNLGTAFARDNQLLKAAEQFREALSISPYLEQARYNLVLLLIKFGHYREANDVYLQGINLQASPFNNDNTPPSLGGSNLIDSLLWEYTVNENTKDVLARYFSDAIYFEQQFEFEKAKEIYEGLHLLLPDNIKVLNNLGLIYHNIGDIEKAIEYLEMGLSKAPDNYELHYNIANSYKKNGQRNKAAIHLLDAIRYKKDFSSAYNNLGILYAEENRYDEALAQFNTLLDINPTSSQALVNIGIIKMKQGDKYEALYYLNLALSNSDNPDSIEYLINQVSEMK